MYAFLLPTDSELRAFLYFYTTNCSFSQFFYINSIRSHVKIASRFFARPRLLRRGSRVLASRLQSGFRILSVSPRPKKKTTSHEVVFWPCSTWCEISEPSGRRIKSTSGYPTSSRDSLELRSRLRLRWRNIANLSKVHSTA